MILFPFLSNKAVRNARQVRRSGQPGEQGDGEGTVSREV